MKRLIQLAVSGAFTVLLSASSARGEVIRLTHCDGASQVAIDLLFQEQGALSAGVPPSLARAAASGSDKALRLMAVGPVLGSMDSRNVVFQAVCSASGIHVTATITRADGYGGAVLKFAMWRPLVRLDLPYTGKQPEVAVTWRMVSSAGEEIHQGDLPNGLLQHYPFTLKYAAP